FAGAAEDRVEELLFRGELALALWRDLADEDVAGLDAGADPDDAVLVEVAEHLLGDVGDVAGELLASQLGLADFHVERVDVDAREGVVLDESLADDDGVFEVVAVEGVERDEDVLADGQLAVERGGAVGDDIALLDLLAGLDARALVEAGALVEADELAQDVFVGV